MRPLTTSHCLSPHYATPTGVPVKLATSAICATLHTFHHPLTTHIAPCPASTRAVRPSDDDDYDSPQIDATAAADRSDKENVATLLNIQRGLAKVLAERGIASPFKPQPHSSTTESTIPSPASSYRTSASRVSSSLSSSFSSSSTVSESMLSSVTSADTFSGTAPLAGARGLQLREDERVRGVRRGYGQGGFKKADVVNRYQQYKAQWEQSSFLHRRQHGR